MILPATNADLGDLLSYATRWCCVGVVIQSLEILWNFEELRDAGLLGCGRVARQSIGFIRRGIQFADRYPVVTVMLALRVIAAASILMGNLGDVSAFAVLAFLVVAQLYYNRRFVMIAGNCETMFLICLTGFWAASLPGGSVLLWSIALTFIAVHVLLAYFVAGCNKLISPPWRTGAQMKQIVAGSSYRIPGLLTHAGTHRVVARSLCWSIILLQLLFPISVLLPTSFFWGFLAAGILFHAGIAVVMGLHGFWWSFIAGYPALYFVHAQLHSILY